MSEPLKMPTRSRKFFLFMIPAYILWLIGQYFFPIFATDQLNVVLPYMMEAKGWTALQVANPNSIGRIIGIPLTLVWGTLIIKLGAKRVFCISLTLYGLFEVLVALASNYTMFSIGFGALPIIGTALLMSTFSLINNWFRSWRGTALGIVTCVSPMSNATVIQYMQKGLVSMGYFQTFFILAMIVTVAGLLGFLLVRETPEQVGVYPDGALTLPPPEKLANEDDVDKIRFRHLFRHKEAWLHCLTFGIMTFALCVYPGFFVTRFTELGFTPAQATAFTYGYSFLGAGLSLISGIIDDKLGTRKATILMASLYFLGTIGLRFGSVDHPWMIWFGIVSLGGIVGASPNLNPSMATHIYGKKSFNRVYRFLNTGVYILPALAMTYTTGLYDLSGSLNLPYLLMIPISGICLLCTIFMKKKLDLTADIEAELKVKAKK